jgi:uncharacterized protein YndB with AHSA1/START domain
MTDALTIPPLTLEFDVAASVEHAFATWFQRADLWWPSGHTVSGAPEAIVFEPHVGGRIYERDTQGSEHEWGEVLAWDPPRRVEYLWHLFFARAEATHVVVTFTPARAGTTVRIVHTGFEALGEQGFARREGNLGGWTAVTAGYRHIVETIEETSS